jgi:hypothetical protein
LLICWAFSIGVVRSGLAAVDVFRASLVGLSLV